MPNPKNPSRSAQQARPIDKIWIGVGGAATLVGLFGFYGIVAFIADNRIDAKLSSPEFRSSLARELGANVVFNGKGSVLNDPQGYASEFIDSIEVKAADLNSGTAGALVTIHFRKHVEIEPILKCYEVPVIAIGERVDKFSWKFSVIAQMTVGVREPTSIDSESVRYLVTIVR